MTFRVTGPSRRWLALVVIMLGPWIAGRVSWAGESADRLLSLVPADAGLTVVVDDLRGFAANLREAGIARRLRESPVVDRWLGSKDGEQFLRSIGDLEALFQTDLAHFRDDILGDAVVLSIHPGPEGAPEAVGGLVLVHPRDRTLLERLLATVNGMEAGGQGKLEERRHGGAAYAARTFRDPARPPDFYRVFDDGTFAWTNAEPLIHQVIARRNGSGEHFADRPGVQRVRAEMPERSIARAFIDPTFLAGLAAADPDATRAENLPPRIRDYVEALDYLGLAIEWDDGPILHAIEDYEPTRLPSDWSVGRADDETTLDPLLARVPADALGLGASALDFIWIYDALLDANPAVDAAQRERIDTLLRGVVLDRDPRAEFLSRLGPATLAFVEAVESSPAEGVLVVSLGEDEGVGRAVDNALRTALTLYALDATKRQEDWRVRSIERDGQRLTVLARGDDPAMIRLAYGLGPGVIAIGTGAASVARFLDSDDSTGASGAFAEVRRERFPNAGSFAFVDLGRVGEHLRARRAAIGRAIASTRADRSEAQAGEDLDQLMEMMSLFRWAYFASEGDGERLVHRRFGLGVRIDP